MDRPLSKWFSIIVLLTLLHCLQADFIELPPVKHPKTQKIKLGKLYLDRTCEIDGIVMRNVSKASSFEPFPPCVSNPPQLTVSQLEYAIYPTQAKKSSKILTTFDQIKHSQYELDSYIDRYAEGQHIYIMLRTGIILVYKRASDSNLMSFYKAIAVVLPTDGELLEVGYFVKMGFQGPLLFVNNKYAIKVTLNDASILEGYQPAQQYDTFQTALGVEGGRYLVIGSYKKGICVYLYDKTENKLKMASHMGRVQLFGEARLSQLQISDLAYDEQKKQLLFLDMAGGVYLLKLTLLQKQPPLLGANETVDQQQNHDGYIDGIKLIWDAPVLLHFEPLCDIIYFDPGTRFYYAACPNHIVKHSVDNIQDFQLLPHPQIKVREIEATGRMILYTGRNIFKIYDSIDRSFLHYYQEFIKINKAHLVMDTEFTGHFYFTNEYMIIEGFFSIESPYVTCLTSNSKYQGQQQDIKLLVIGPCDKNYIQKYYKKWYAEEKGNLKAFNGLNIQKNYTCIYNIQQTLYFWSPGEVNTHALLIAFIVCLSIGVLVLIVWILYKMRVNRLALMLEQYQSLDEQSTMSASSSAQKKTEGKHQELIQEDDGTDEKSKQKEGTSEMHFSSNKNKEKADEQSSNQENYDIE